MHQEPGDRTARQNSGARVKEKVKNGHGYAATPVQIAALHTNCGEQMERCVGTVRRKAEKYAENLFFFYSRPIRVSFFGFQEELFTDAILGDVAIWCSV